MILVHIISESMQMLAVVYQIVRHMELQQHRTQHWAGPRLSQFWLIYGPRAQTCANTSRV